MAYRADIEQAGKEVAAELGEGWESNYDPDFVSDAVRIKHADGRTIYGSLARYSHRGRWEFIGSAPDFGTLPYNSQPRFKRLSITASGEKTSAALARDITRRLLPDYNAAYAECIATLEQITGARDAQGVLAEQLAAALGHGAHVLDDHGRGDGRVYFPVGLPGHTVQASYGGASATFERLTVPAELALEIIEAIAAYGTGAGPSHSHPPYRDDCRCSAPPSSGSVS